jgi:hypothetical protein
MNFKLLRNKPMHKDIPTAKANIQRICIIYHLHAIQIYPGHKYITYILNEQEQYNHEKWESDINDVITMFNWNQ